MTRYYLVEDFPYSMTDAELVSVHWRSGLSQGFFAQLESIDNSISTCSIQCWEGSLKKARDYIKIYALKKIPLHEPTLL